MMVTFISQCEKKALKRTRRVLDSFANRIGDNTWQTIITQEGLDAVQNLLRKTASKSTAVSCHWIRSRSRSQFLWVVGNKSKFNSEGVVPVHYSEKEMSEFQDDMSWKSKNIILFATAIAALFHDFGKANILFQKKITGQSNEISEPYRHEWISFILFYSFTKDREDVDWLNDLENMEFSYNEDFYKKTPSFKHMPAFAQLVAWLIVSHHRLPVYPSWKENANSQPDMQYIDNWIENNFEVQWNSYSCKDLSQQYRVDNNWQFVEFGLPINSNKWKAYSCLASSNTKKIISYFLNSPKDILHDNLFTSHISRLVLMLADHYYSAKTENDFEWRDENYKVGANSSENQSYYKQQLDEHLIGVSDSSQKILSDLIKLNSTLICLPKNDFLSQNVKGDNKNDFGWQNDAVKLIDKCAKQTKVNGFFGINMASTGKGKTIANSKIMYSLGENTGKTRFTVALGLRTLTLQTGNEFKTMVELKDEDLAIAVGGKAVKQLFENEQKNSFEQRGSESLGDIENTDIVYDSSIYEHSLSKWMKQEKNIDSLICAPVLVCTIDHLIPATDGVKGGKQIGSMLRLLTSDLVLDEPDDFGLEDLPALCRLVHMAGMMGSRVLLSTATMPPSLSYALFLAYKNGWNEYAKDNIDGFNGEIQCTWFDEYDAQEKKCLDIKLFKSQHEDFTKKRVKKLEEATSKRKAKIVQIAQNEDSDINWYAQTIRNEVDKLHKIHNQKKDNKTISIGIVRMANINPLVSTAIELLNIETPKDTQIHYCIYHSKYPLAIRSYIENKLDTILKRKDPDKIWDFIKDDIKDTDIQNHIFVVLASPVAEVGRDHDYDWAIVEPSSMRSIIQLAGRVLRHRHKEIEEPNIILLNQNYNSLQGKSRCFIRPGFELETLNAKNGHELINILDLEQYENINSIARIIAPPDKKLSKIVNSWENLVDLEHLALTRTLFNGDKPANIWWNKSPHWCGEVQRQLPFRKSPKDIGIIRFRNNEYSEFSWKEKNENVIPIKLGELTSITIEELQEIKVANGNCFWFDIDEVQIYNQLLKEIKNMNSLEDVSKMFGELRVVEYSNNDQVIYQYNPQFGLFQLKENR